MGTRRDNPEIDLKQVRVQDRFWSGYQRLVREKVLPYQWRALNDRVPGAEKSHAIANFKVAAGLRRGGFYGYVFQDSDVAKWLETVAYSLSLHPDADLERRADEVVALLEKAQRPDGYLDTYFIVKEPQKRWTNLREAHELYCAGHLIEAAVAYHAATGKRRVLDVACRLADLLDRTFGAGRGKIRGYCGHPEIELSLVKLYEATAERRYLALSRYFIEERGRKPLYFEREARKPGAWTVWAGLKDIDLAYFQCEKPVRKQSEAKGHAVRVVYLYSAVADLARLTGDRGLKRACMRIWDDITRRKMYVTGGIGSTATGEAFTGPYDLPNDTPYAETCAAIGLVLFAHRMLKMDVDAHYADVMETAVYNGALSGISLDGTGYFYVNPLEVRPEICSYNPGFRHVKPVRQAWFGCACCPPNIARLIASIGKYAYTRQGDDIHVHLFLGSQARLTVGGQEVVLTQKTGYPYEGRVRLIVGISKPHTFTLNLRIPGWCATYRCKLNGKALKGGKPKNGYLPIRKTWKDGDTVEMVLDMPVTLVRSNPQLPNDAGKAAIRRGPLVYCLEEVDNGADLHDIHIPPKPGWRARLEPRTLGGTVVIRGKGLRMDGKNWKSGRLYSSKPRAFKNVEIKAVPYSLWCNRKPGEMRVWLNET